MNQEIDNDLRLFANITWILGTRYSDQWKLSQIRKVVDIMNKSLTLTEQVKVSELRERIEETKRYC